MSALIGLIGISGLLVLLAGGVVAYRWSRARRYATDNDSAAAEGSDWAVSRTGRDTQAGRI